MMDLQSKVIDNLKQEHERAQALAARGEVSELAQDIAKMISRPAPMIADGLGLALTQADLWFIRGWIAAQVAAQHTGPTVGELLEYAYPGILEEEAHGDARSIRP
jgi:hypothetical protein